MKERTVYRETYKKGAAKIRPDRLPTLQHSNGMQPVEAHILAAGKVMRGNDAFEYQDLRLYFTEPRY